jgi:hypothetical protein
MLLCDYKTTHVSIYYVHLLYVAYVSRARFSRYATTRMPAGKLVKSLTSAVDIVL